jgi:hypothetical protein
MVLSSYRRDDFANPDGYAVQLAMVLERYPDEIVREATSPITGIQRTCKFPPSLAEFVQFCDELRRRASWTTQWDARSEKQLAERDEFDAMTKEECLERRRQVAERFRKQVAETFKAHDSWKHLGFDPRQVRRAQDQTG